jgi:hypothetical protein
LEVCEQLEREREQRIRAIRLNISRNLKRREKRRKARELRQQQQNKESLQ